MTFARRLSAATMAVVLALFPVAMERCRTACVAAGGETTQAAPAAHPCHEALSDEPSGARLDPMARACGHSDETPTYESVTLAAAKDRSIVPAADIQPLLRDLTIPNELAEGSAPVRSVLPRVVPTLDLPLRL